MPPMNTILVSEMVLCLISDFAEVYRTLGIRLASRSFVQACQT